MYKVDDDLRQDQLVIDMLRIMQKLWNKVGIGNLNLACYHCIPTWRYGGLLQIVPDSQTLATVESPIYGGIARYLHLDDDKISVSQRDKTLTTFMRSLAGYCVASKVLGFGDRHNDNVMLSKNGRFFHIDFGFCFGRRTRFLTSHLARQKFPFVFTGAMHEVLNSNFRLSDQKNYYSLFQDLCCKAYLCVRRNHEEILRCILPLVNAGLTDLNQETVQYVRSQVRLELSEKEACTAFVQEIESCYKDSVKKIDETGRKFAKFLSKDDTVAQTALLQTELTRLQPQIGFNVLLPFGLKVGPVVPEKCTVMRSKAKPFMLAFQAPANWNFEQNLAK